ncbi:methyltransferase [Gracilimonas tropica]|uniref:methyltransferase n=1 Tax=Gracilimonas tropica TaxID=454600 RepID=UPI00037A2507|nr:methyltransferase [Gracilimonas tropica]
MIPDQFGSAAATYHQEAKIQRKVADGLMSSLLPWKGILPEGTILEVGCGTGFLTEQLIKHFPERKFLITDVSPNMLDFCKQRLQAEGLLKGKDIQFIVLDVHDFEPDSHSFSMVISNFTPHWFKDTSMVLERLSESLLPGGLLLTSFPGNHTFEEWYEHCLKLGLPHTANPLPNVEEVVVKLSMGPMQIDYYENDLFQEFESSLEFFRHLKRIGASYSIKKNSLGYKQFKLLTTHWDEEADGKIKVKWHIVYLAAKKDVA